MIGNRPNTMETITWEGTIKSILSLGIVQVLLRLFVSVVLLIAWVLLTGRGAGPILIGASIIIATGLRVRSFVPLEPHIKTGKVTNERAKTAIVTGMLGITLVVLWATGYWPQLWWELGEGRLWVAWATGSRSVPVIWLWIRGALIVASPWAVIQPFKNVDWALAIETLWSKAREAQFTQADIESPAVRRPRAGKRIRHNTTQAPAAVIQQAAPQPNKPDTTTPMKVDGV